MIVRHDACCCFGASAIVRCQWNCKMSVLEVRLNDASIKSFHNCFREKMLGILWKANSTRSFLSD